LFSDNRATAAFIVLLRQARAPEDRKIEGVENKHTTLYSAAKEHKSNSCFVVFKQQRNSCSVVIK